MTKVDPVTYAENTLGVHRVFEEAERRFALHAEASENVTRTQDEIRALKAQVEEREIEIVSDERAKEHGLSKTAFGDHLKEVLREDPDLRALRSKISNLEGMRNDYEQQVKHHQLGVQLASARMQELEGLLSFYAACKLANAVHPSQPSST